MRTVRFNAKIFEDLLEWNNENPKMVSKILRLMIETARTPFEGTGKPEPLKYIKGAWSRRITDKDRLVYFVSDEFIEIIGCKGHYE